MYDNDYKHVIREMSKTMIGARFSYGEVVANERIPFKFQTIVDRYILPYEDANETIAEHMKKMTPDDKNYRVYEALRTNIRFYRPKTKGSGYEEVVYPVNEFVANHSGEQEKILIQEIVISNLALTAFKI